MLAPSLTQWPVAAQHRPERATGCAMSVASSLLEITFPQAPSHIMLFIGGPCTSGPGLIVDTDLGETIRAHVDIEREKAPHMKEAQKFYESVADRCRKNRQSVDLFACCLDQVGLLEMRSCIETTGGLCVLGEAGRLSLGIEILEGGGPLICQLLFTGENVHGQLLEILQVLIVHLIQQGGILHENHLVLLQLLGNAIHIFFGLLIFDFHVLKVVGSLFEHTEEALLLLLLGGEALELPQKIGDHIAQLPHVLGADSVQAELIFQT